MTHSTPLPWNWLDRENSRDRPLAQRQPSHPLLRWDREFDNWFERMLGDMAWTTPAPHAQPIAPFRPGLDILEQPQRYVITAELPGMTREDIDLTLDGNVLTLSGAKREPENTGGDEGYHYSERRFGRFQRILTLPADADGDAMTAAFDNGLLVLEVPRHENQPASRKRIDIR